MYDLPEHANQFYKLGEISIIGGGSAGSTDTDGNNDYFNLLNFSPKALQVDMYRSRKKGLFECFKEFCAPITRFDDGGLKLDDWNVVA